MKQDIKLTVGIKWTKTPPPVFIEGEAPGVFSMRVVEVDVPDEGAPGHAMFLKWLLDTEDEMINEVVEFKAFKEVE